jgi:hypothetical protein
MSEKLCFGCTNERVAVYSNDQYERQRKASIIGCEQKGGEVIEARGVIIIIYNGW